MAKDKKKGPLESWQPLVESVKLTPDPKGDGFILSIPMAKFDGDEEQTGQFVEELNEAVAQKVSTTPGLRLHAKFVLRDVQTSRYTRAVAQFARFADARQCLSLVRACGLPAHEDITLELEQYGKAYDKWAAESAKLSFFARLLGRGPAKPTTYVPPLKPRLDLVAGGEKSDTEDEESPARPKRKKRRDRGSDTPGRDRERP